MTAYTLQLLHEIVARDGCNLSQEYTKVTANTRIAFTCGTANCQHTHDKALDKMRVSGGFCKVCTDKRKLDKAKATSLLIYGVENPSQCPGIKAQIAQTFMQKYGTTTPQCLEEQKAKARQTNLLKYGVENPFQAEVCKEKGRRTMVNKYGAPNPQQCAAIKAKTKSTMRMRYGVDNPMQNAEVQKKGKATNMFKYGVENPFQANECKEKSKQTCLNKYGTEYAAQSEIFKEKVQQVCMKKYGVRSPSQHPDILDKQFKSACKLKDYPFPCGKVVQVQGYEPFALNDLVSLGYTAHDIVVEKAEVPEIWYEKDGVKRRYYCDMFIPAENKMIEVKSTYTYGHHSGNVQEKAKASVEAGYMYEIWVYERNGERVQTIQFDHTPLSTDYVP